VRSLRPLTLAVVATAVLLTGCSGSDSSSDAAPDPAPSAQGVSEASKGEACEHYRDLSAQVEAANEEALSVTVSSEEDGQKVTELKTKVSELTEQADAAYALCYAEGQEAESTP
jgi:hypothetical protein